MTTPDPAVATEVHKVLDEIIKGKYTVADNFSERFVSQEQIVEKIASIRSRYPLKKKR